MRRGMGCESPISRKRVFKNYVFIVFLMVSSSIETEKVEPGSTMYNIRARITKKWNGHMDRQCEPRSARYDIWNSTSKLD